MYCCGAKRSQQIRPLLFDHQSVPISTYLRPTLSDSQRRPDCHCAHKVITNGCRSTPNSTGASRGSGDQAPSVLSAASCSKTTITILPIAPDQRPGGADPRLSTRALSPGLLHLVLFDVSSIPRNPLLDCCLSRFLRITPHKATILSCQFHQRLVRPMTRRSIARVEVLRYLPGLLSLAKALQCRKFPLCLIADTLLEHRTQKYAAILHNPFES